jgi:hypothetical protein
MPQIDIDGAASRLSTDNIRGQSGSTITIVSGHNLVGSGSGLTALPAANLTGTIAAISGVNLTALNATQLTSGTIPIARIADDAITTAKIAPDAITAAEIGDNVINSEHYAAASIDAEHLAVGKDGALSLAILSNTSGADHTAAGPQTNTISSGYSSTIMDLVYLGAGNKWLEADADATGTSINMLGIALEAKTDAQGMNVALPGSFVRDDTWNWTGGVPLYVSNTPGAITATKPTGSGDVVRTVGFAVTSNEIYFNPSSDYVTLA